jgi:hypothetical protein
MNVLLIWSVRNITRAFLEALKKSACLCAVLADWILATVMLIAKIILIVIVAILSAILDTEGQ